MTDKNEDLNPAAQAALDNADKDAPVLKPKKASKKKAAKKPAPEPAVVDEVDALLGDEPTVEGEVEPEHEPELTVETFNEKVAEMRDEMPEPVVDEKITVEAPTPKKPKEKRVEIFIDDEVGHPNYKFVGVNGRGYQIQRGKPVIVPEGVVGVLNNSTITRLIQNDKGERSTITHIATPFRVLRYVD